MVRMALLLQKRKAKKTVRKKNTVEDNSNEGSNGRPSTADLERAMNVANEMEREENVEHDWKDEREELEEIKKKIHPKLPTIVLFFRWARRPASHFNSDSTSLVKTLALQSGFSPV
eukprot:scaffold6507_cov90-Cylindrotheca_fusiformis.AAC.1